MTRWEGKAFLGRRTDKLPPLTVKLARLKGAQPCDMVLQQDVRDQRTAAYRTENTYARLPPAGKENQDNRKKKEENAAFPEQ